MDDISGHAKVLIYLLNQREYGIGCEVGVHTGDTTVALLAHLPKIRVYHAIDPWVSYEQYDGTKYRKPGHKQLKTWGQAKKRFMEVIKPFHKRVSVYEMTSVEACKKIKDESLDWIFIDANYEYPYIKENLELWTPKVKEGGIVSGHDYGGKWRDIKKAVDEFVQKNKLHIEANYVWWFDK